MIKLKCKKCGNERKLSIQFNLKLLRCPKCEGIMEEI